MIVPTSNIVQREILQALKHGGLNLFELADTIDQAPFRVRTELKALRRDQLVRQRTGHSPWALTERGAEVAWADNQIGLV